MRINDNDNCNCPNPKCNGKLTMIHYYSKRYGHHWICKKCKTMSCWSWTR